MPADAGTRVERLEAERLGGRRVDDVPQVDAELLAEHGHLVDQRDVHVPVGVLEQLGHLGLAGTGRTDHGVDELAVEGGRRVGALRGAAADHLGRVAQPVARVAGVDPLGAEREVEVAPGHQPAGLEDRPHDLVGRAGECRRLEDHEHPGAQVPGDRVDGRLDRTEVGPALGGQGGGYADDDGVGGGEHGLVRGRPEAPRHHRRYLLVAQVVHVRAPAVEQVDDPGGRVEPDHAEAGPRGLLGEREADVAEPDDDQLLAHAVPLLVRPPDPSPDRSRALPGYDDAMMTRRARR